MGFQFNGLKANVTISGTVASGATSYSSSQTFATVNLVNQVLTGGYDNFKTVTAGKKFYVSQIWFSSLTHNLAVCDNTTALITLTAGFTGSITFPSPLQFSNSFRLNSNNGDYVWMFAVGFEQ